MKFRLVLDIKGDFEKNLNKEDLDEMFYEGFGYATVVIEEYEVLEKDYN